MRLAGNMPDAIAIDSIQGSILDVKQRERLLLKNSQYEVNFCFTAV
ncbi:MAG: hypothetical protein ACSLEL_03420 [Candidatus Malihini olakiniferum]